MPTNEEEKEDSGWKQLQRDVFRPPKNPLLLSILIGSGVQIGVMESITIFLAFLGFVKPFSRGYILTLIVFLYVFLGSFAGYYSARFYKMFKVENYFF